MIICTAATKGSPYEPLMSIQRNIYGERIVTTVYPKTTWGEGTKIKPKTILSAFALDPYVFWMDADCAVDLPEHPPEGDWDVCLFDNVNPNHINRIAAAFILFKDTTNSRKFLARWDENNQNVKKDHPALTRTINEMRGKMSFYDGSEWLKDRQILNALMPERGLFK
jgi:hypothetical protein